jgi:uncharacterized protein YjcR
MSEKITKTDIARAMLLHGVPVKTVAEKTGFSVAYVRTVSWRMRHPTYAADWMASKRLADVRGYFGELDKQAKKRLVRKPRGPNLRVRRARLRKVAMGAAG